MTNCPLCEFENIEGVDVCEQCGQPLDDLHLPAPRSAAEQGLIKDRINSLSPKAPVVVHRDTRVGEVLQLLVDRKIGCVFVGDEDKVVGVFSERDALLRLNVDAAQYLDRPIFEFMTPNPQGLTADARIAYAVHQMDLGGYRHIPIWDNEKRPVGVISVRDILGYLTERMTGNPK